MRNVLKFTFIQHVSLTAYKLTTFIIAFCLLALSAGGFLIADAFLGSETVSDITKVFVCDTSILNGTDYNVLHESENELYKDVVFVKAESDDPEKAAEEAAADGDHSCVLEIKNKESGSFAIRIIKPEGFAAEKKSAKNLSKFIANNFKFAISEKSEFTAEQKDELLTGTEIEMSVVGEDSTSEKTEMIKMIFPVVCGVCLYIMLCIYGQGVSRSVVVEKDSKMMETLLVMIKPYDLIFGKIFGMYFAAVLQIVVWIVSLGIGLSIGISSSGATGEKVTEFLRIFMDKGGFSPAAFVVAVIALFVGFFLYVSLAAFAGTFASKTEEINNYFGIYTMVVVICWMFPYINQLEGNDHILSILRFVPFTAPFTVPADVILGTTGIPAGIVSTLIVAASTVVIVMLAAKVYKLLVLYRGEPLKIKEVFKMLKRNSD